MHNTQSKFIALLSARVQALGYQVVKNSDWANTGTLFIETPDSMSPTLSIRYNFQHGYQTFSVDGGLGIEEKMIKNDELNAFIERIVGVLPRAKSPKARKSETTSSQVQVALMELIEQAAREDDGNFFAGAGVGNFAGVTRLTMPNGQVFTIIAHKALKSEGK